ncbi:MAG TPA: hypothetical protein VMG10_29585 [Gemmataceae bacterium]|nr:hypothetical protein [Gemmataceae bacterium]
MAVNLLDLGELTSGSRRSYDGSLNHGARQAKREWFDRAVLQRGNDKRMKFEVAAPKRVKVIKKSIDTQQYGPGNDFVRGSAEIAIDTSAAGEVNGDLAVSSIASGIECADRGRPGGISASGGSAEDRQAGNDCCRRSTGRSGIGLRRHHRALGASRLFLQS